jgi:UDPglucose 6-dehydrogenase
VQALALSSKEYDYDFKILDAVMEVNQSQKLKIVEKMMKYYNNDVKGKKFALWGLAFKPETDDIREAPALYIIDELTKAGAEIVAYDPEGMENVRKMKGNILAFADNAYDALEGADALIIATEWQAFRNPDFKQMEEKLALKVIFDGRNLYDLHKMIDLGYYYNSIGRATVNQEA